MNFRFDGKRALVTGAGREDPTQDKLRCHDGNDSNKDVKNAVTSLASLFTIQQRAVFGKTNVENEIIKPKEDQKKKRKEGNTREKEKMHDKGHIFTGIGRGIIKKLAECGAECVALSKTQEHLDSLKNEVPGIQTVMVDLADWASTRQALENVGKIDLLVNNAAILIMSPFLETAKDDLDKVLDVNFKAVFNVSQIVARSMVERGNGGAIVNVSSVASRTAVRNVGSYCSSKGALDSLTQVMATELGPHKIRVNAVHPHMVPSTDMGNSATGSLPLGALEYILSRIPLNRFPDVEDVVNAVLFLLSDKASNLNGIALPIDGGFEAN